MPNDPRRKTKKEPPKTIKKLEKSNAHFCPPSDVCVRVAAINATNKAHLTDSLNLNFFSIILSFYFLFRYV